MLGTGGQGMCGSTYVGGANGSLSLNVAITQAKQCTPDIKTLPNERLDAGQVSLPSHHAQQSKNQKSLHGITTMC